MGTGAAAGRVGASVIAYRKIFPALAALLALVAAACASVARDDASWAASGPMYRNVGGGYVPGSTTYHGSGGP